MRTLARLAAAFVILAASIPTVSASDCECDRVSIRKLDLESMIYDTTGQAFDTFSLAGQSYKLTVPAGGGGGGNLATADSAIYRTPDDFNLQVENGKRFQLRLGSEEAVSLHRAAMTFGCGVSKVGVDGTTLSVEEKEDDSVAVPDTKYPQGGQAILKREGCRVVLEITGAFDCATPDVPVEFTIIPFKPKGTTCADNEAAPPPSAEAIPSPTEASGQPPGGDLKASFFAGTGADGISPGPIRWTATDAVSAVGLGSLRVPGLEGDGSRTPATYTLAGTDPRPAKASRLQLKTQTLLFDARSDNDTLTLRFYDASNFTTPDLDVDADDDPDFYDTDGATPLKTVTYSGSGSDILVSVNGQPTHMLSITTANDTTTTSWASLAESRRIVTIRDTADEDHPVVTREEWSGLGAGTSVLVSRTVGTFEPSSASPDGFRLQERVRHASPGQQSAEDETETFHYGTGDTVSLRVSSDGSWETNGTAVPSALVSLLSAGPEGATLVKTTVTGRPWLDGAPPEAGDPPTPSASVVEVTRGFDEDTTISETFTAGVLSGRTITTKETEDGYAKTVTKRYTSDAGWTVSESWMHATGSNKGRLYRTISPGGACTTYSFATMAEGEGGSFEEDEEGTFSATYATRGTTTSPNGLADEAGALTTRTPSIRDADGLVVREETQAYTGSGYQTMTATTYGYDKDASGRVTKTTTSRDGRVVSELEESGNTTTTTDEAGRVMVETRDNQGRLSTSVDKGGGGQPDITTSYTYSGSTTTVVRSVPGLAPVVSSTTRNLLGESVSSTDEAGTVTTWMRNRAARTETTARNGVERIVSTFRDGRFKSESGNGVIARRATYSVDGDGFVTAMESTGPVTEGNHSPRWTATTTDWAGRTIAVTTPGTPGPTATNADIVTSIEYDESGRAWRTATNSGPAPRLVLSDALGMTATSGADIDEDDSLVLTGADRFSSESRRYQLVDGQWWEVVTRTTPLDATNAYTATTRTLMDASAGDTVESVNTVGQGVQTASETTSRTYNRATKTTTTESVATPGGTTTTVEVNGLVVSRAVPEGQALEKFYYDGFRRLARTIDSRGGTAGRTYGNNGRMATTTDHSGHVTTYSYFGPAHANAGLVSTIIKEQNAGEATTTYTYNALGQTEELAGSSTYRRTYTYDDFGAPLTMTTHRGSDSDPDANPATTTWTRDPATGLVTRKEHQDGKGTDYNYTADGLPATRTWERGVTTTWAYADGSRDLTTISYTDDTPAVAYTNFDRLGRPGTVTETRPNSVTDTTALSYDPASGAESVHHGTGHSVLPGVVLDASANDDGRPTGYTVKVGTTPVHAWEYAYDALGRLGGVSGHGLDSTLGCYPGTGLLHEQIVKSGQDEIQRRTRHIDLAGRTYGVVNRAPDPDNNDAPRTVASIAHSYDNRDRRITARREDGTVWTYGYNDRSEVTSATKRTADATLVPGLLFGYSYDGMGNRLSASRGSPAATTDYEPNAVNQYTEIDHPGADDILVRSADSVTVVVGAQTINASAVDTFHGARITGDNDPDVLFLPLTVTSGTFSESGHVWLPPASFTPVYDDDGNQLDDGRWIHTWDAENRLVRMQTKASAVAAGAPNQTIDYTYDFRSRRIGRKCSTTVGSGENATTTITETRYLYDDWNCVAEFSPLEPSGLKLDASYVWSLDLSNTLQGAGGVGGLLSVSQITDNQQQITRLPACDANGNIIGWTDTAGRLVQRQDYDAFGNMVICERLAIDASTSKRLTYGFSTKPLDPDTGLHYYIYRWYGARDARWRSRDPIEERGGVNLYGFVRNSPLGRIDFVGRQDCYGDIGYLMWESERDRKEKEILQETEFNMASNLEAGAELEPAIKATLAEVENTFENMWKEKERCESCLAIGTNRLRASFNQDEKFWDISALREDLGKMPKIGAVDYRAPQAGTRAYDRTWVHDFWTFKGKAHRDYSINYALWGKMNSLCRKWVMGKPLNVRLGTLEDAGGILEWSKTEATAIVSLYKFGQQAGESLGMINWKEDEGQPIDSSGAKAFTHYGYDGQDPSYAAFNRGIRPSTRVYPPAALRWRWMPHHPGF